MPLPDILAHYDLPRPTIPEHWFCVSVRCDIDHARRSRTYRAEFMGHGSESVWLEWNGHTWDPARDPGRDSLRKKIESLAAEIGRLL